MTARCRSRRRSRSRDLKWAGWSAETTSGKPNPLRPIVLTHAGDGSNRVFVATQHGVVHVFANDQKATETKVFLDIQDRVKYDDKTNEEGFLGLAFHPKFKENGEVFVFYTPKKENKVNVVSRFRLSKNDPTKLDPASEEQLVRFTDKLFWNHDGGTMCFGPDGFLYIIHGDGGMGGDPKENGQNLGVLLRQDPAHRRGQEGRGQELRGPEGQPVRRQDGRAAGDLGLRHPQHLAHELRPKTGQLVGRRSGPEPLRRDQHHREGRQLRLEPARVVPPVRAEGRGRRTRT